MPKIYGQLEDAQVEVLSADPSNLPVGRLWLNKTTHKVKTIVNTVTRAFVFEDDTQTLTNKTLTAPHITTPTGIVKADVGLSNVDNTSDATKNAAAVTLTNKTIDGDDNTIQDLALTSLKTVLADASKFLVRDASGVVISNTKAVPTGTVVGTSDTQSLTNKTFTNATNFSAEVVFATHTDTAAGSAQTGAIPTTLIKNLTGALTSLAGIAAVTGAQPLMLVNLTGGDVTVLNQSGSATASNRLITGTDADITLKNGASLWLVYDLTNSRWRVVGGSGGSTFAYSSDLTLTASDTIAINASSSDQVWLVQGSAGPIDLSTTPFSGTAQDGTLITLIGNNDSFSVTITHNDASGGCVGNFSSITLYKYQTARFRYLSSISRWVYVQ